jgi:hypothetical protein
MMKRKSPKRKRQKMKTKTWEFVPVRPQTIEAYRAWMKAANAEPKSGEVHYADIARQDARIRRLKARYEKLIREDKAR